MTLRTGKNGPRFSLPKHRDGRYDPGQPKNQLGSAQICFGDAQARDFILNKLSSFIDDARPDYLKLDNNFWINCNRSGHGHGTEDGNFAHHRGLRTLRAGSSSG